jgi:hypothetical protein
MIAQILELSKIMEARKQAKRISELEVCVSCNELTDVPKNMHVDQREHYVEGAGQLHPHCYEEVYTPENIKKSEEWFEGFIKSTRGEY